MKKKSKSFEIALSAVSCAFATIFLVLGTLNNYLLVFGYIAGTLSLTIPLTRSFWLGDLLAYIAATILSLLFGGLAFFWRLLPFIMFFGLHPLVNFLQFRFRVNRWLAYLVKAAWFDAMLFLYWKFVCGMTSNFAFIDEYILPVILIGGTLVFFVYDFMIIRCQISANRIVKKIKRD